jgi:hypothetical protein
LLPPRCPQGNPTALFRYRETTDFDCSRVERTSLRAGFTRWRSAPFGAVFRQLPVTLVGRPMGLSVPTTYEVKTLEVWCLDRELVLRQPI